MSEAKRGGVGRKPKLTLAEKKDVVNRYVVAHGHDRTVLTKHGLYEKLAIFARRLKEEYGTVRAHDFWRADIKEYISMLANDLSADVKEKRIGCAYVPLDLSVINQLAHRHRYTELIEVLRKRENDISDLYNNIAETAAQNDFVISLYTTKAEELEMQERKNSRLESEVERLTNEVQDQKEKVAFLQNENRTLRRSIREKENEISILSHNATMRGLGIRDNLQAFIEREESKLAEENPRQKSECKIISLIPNLED